MAVFNVEDYSITLTLTRKPS